MNKDTICDSSEVRNAISILDMSGEEALDFLMKHDSYSTSELPEYFDFGGVLDYARKTICNRTLAECLADGEDPEKYSGVNLAINTNKDGKYGVRPLTLSNPFLYYMLARDLCSAESWTKLKECFKLYQCPKLSACSLPLIKTLDRPESFHNATTILNWWKSMEQKSIELSLDYSYMFVTDITNCFGEILPESIAWALSMKDTPHETDTNNALAANIQRYLRAMQHGRNRGIPQGSKLFSLIAEIVLGYADMLFTQKVNEACKKGELPADIDYQVIRYVDDYRIFCNDRDYLDKLSYILQEVLEHLNFRMNTSKTKVTSDLIADSIKPDKAFYILNTPIVRKMVLPDAEGEMHYKQVYDFNGFQKHLLYIYEFSRKYPNAGQLRTLLSAFSRRLDELFKTVRYKVIENYFHRQDDENPPVPKLIYDHLEENITAMVAIAVQIAADNVSAAHYALRVASQMLDDMHESLSEKKTAIIKSIYKKLRSMPNSAILQIWLQNITHSTDDWSNGEPYDMPLCRLVAGRPVEIWNNAWLKDEIAADLPMDTIVKRDTLARTEQVITFKERRQYDEYES